MFTCTTCQSVYYAQFGVTCGRSRASLFHCNNELSRERPDEFAKLPKARARLAAQSDTGEYAVTFNFGQDREKARNRLPLGIFPSGSYFFLFSFARDKLQERLSIFSQPSATRSAPCKMEYLFFPLNFIYKDRMSWFWNFRRKCFSIQQRKYFSKRKRKNDKGALRPKRKKRISPLSAASLGRLFYLRVRGLCSPFIVKLSAQQGQNVYTVPRYAWPAARGYCAYISTKIDSREPKSPMTSPSSFSPPPCDVGHEVTKTRARQGLIRGGRYWLYDTFLNHRNKIVNLLYF